MTTHRPSGAQKSHEDRGAAAVEFALVVPLLVVLLLGILEMSFLMRDYVSMSSSVRAGARTASAAADAGPGTCQASVNPPPCSPQSVPAFAQAAADTIQKAGTAMPADQIDWLMVYEAGSNGFPVGRSDLQCSTNCVLYVWDDGIDRFRYSSGSWASASVNACVNDPDRDVVGIGLQARHAWLTGLFGDGLTMQERTVMQFEPLESDRCKPGTANAHQ